MSGADNSGNRNTIKPLRSKNLGNKKNTEARINGKKKTRGEKNTTIIEVKEENISIFGKNETKAAKKKTVTDSNNPFRR
ncbi:MAG: hypothetical protein QXZ44_04640 [Ferroplasma sp.]